MVKITIERELKRYIPERVPNEQILNFFRFRYPISNVLSQEVLDAYFKLDSPRGYTLRVRDMDGKLEPTLKSSRKKLTEGVLERYEESRMDKISKILKTPSIKDLSEFTGYLQLTYGLEFVIKQTRIKVFINGVEISLDTVEYFHPSNKKIPPIRNAMGEPYKKIRIYEAEVKNRSYENLAKEITNILYQAGLVGEVCTLSKKEMGKIPLS